MGNPARSLKPVSWTQPSAAARLARPSWIGMPRVTGVAEAAPVTPTAAIESTPAAIVNIEDTFEPSPRSRPSGAPASLPHMRPEAAPGSRPYGARGSGGFAAVKSIPVQTMREVELEDELGAMRREMAMLAAELSVARQRALQENEPEIVRLAMAVAERVVGRELTVDPTLVEEWIHDGVRALPGAREDIIVACAPDVAAMLEGESIEHKVVVDGSLRAGSCELRSANGSTVAIGANARMAAIADALGADGLGQ